MLLSHFTHILQLLNISVFQTYKHHHEFAINKIIKQRNVRFNRYDFLITFDEFRQTIFKSIIIKHAWKRCDIISINLNIILKFLKKKHVVKINSNWFIIASSDFDDWLKRTLRELRSMRKNIKTFRKKYEEIDEFEVIYNQHQIFRLFKAIEQQNHELKLQTKDLNVCLKVVAKKKARDYLLKMMIIKNDIIIVNNIRKLYFKRLKKWITELKNKIKKKIKKN